MLPSVITMASKAILSSVTSVGSPTWYLMNWRDHSGCLSRWRREASSLDRRVTPDARSRFLAAVYDMPILAAISEIDMPLPYLVRNTDEEISEGAANCCSNTPARCWGRTRCVNNQSPCLSPFWPSLTVRVCSFGGMEAFATDFSFESPGTGLPREGCAPSSSWSA